jgi:hypothetical protein
MAGLVPAIHEHPSCEIERGASSASSAPPVFMDRRDEPGDDDL